MASPNSSIIHAGGMLSNVLKKVPSFLKETSLKLKLEKRLLESLARVSSQPSAAETAGSYLTIPSAQQQTGLFLL
ncbi:hypothetical protein BaRGS_00015418 [Batillaria attramentaria]|uniref:Uncharacterized protein n=1 Tax=Batillaria attramentaria TaxID=370345 RepID=A0ABD0L1L3_9CAEN